MQWILLLSMDKSLLLTSVGIILTSSLIKYSGLFFPSQWIGMCKAFISLRLDSTITSVAFKYFLTFLWVIDSQTKTQSSLTIYRYIDDLWFLFLYTCAKTHNWAYESQQKSGSVLWLAGLFIAVKMWQILPSFDGVVWNASQSHGRLTFNFLTKPDFFIFQANNRYDLATEIALVAAGFTFLACLALPFVSGNTYTGMQMD